MERVMNETLKHRLIGLAVIISLATIFVPAVVRKSSQRLDNYSVQIKLPPKPVGPKVVVADPKELFKTVKAAQVDLPKVSTEKQLPSTLKAQRIQFEQAPAEVALPAVAKIELPLQSEIPAVQLAAAERPKRIALPSKPKRQVVAKANPSVKQAFYAVQLASFSQVANAQSLVNRLKGKGYKASYVKVSGPKGPIYKVYAGHSPNKTAVLKLQTQLDNVLQLRGFVVSTGVS